MRGVLTVGKLNWEKKTYKTQLGKGRLAAAIYAS